MRKYKLVFGGQEELQAGVEGGILRGFLDLDEKLRKIPEADKR